MKAWVVAALAVMSAGTAAAQDEKREKIGEWEVTTIVDPITDQGRAMAFLPGDGGRLGIKCDEPAPDGIYIHFLSSDYLGGDFDRRSVTIRFDQDAPTQQIWSFKDSSAVQTSDREAMAFARRVVSAERVVVRGSSYRGEERTGIFATGGSGAREAISRVFEVCQAGRIDP